MVSATAVYPFETLRTRMALDGKMRSINMTSMFVKTIEVEGIRGLYKGLAPAVLGVIIYKGTAFMIYEKILIIFKLAMDNRNIANFLAGGLAAILAQCGNN